MNSSPLEKPKKSSRSRKTLLEDGETYEKSLVSEPLVDKDSTTSRDSSTTQTPTKKSRNQTSSSKTRSKKSATVESPPKVKKTTSKGKSPSCKNNSQSIESSTTSVQESTLKEGVSEPFWSSQARDLYQKLWLPTETGSADSLLNSLNGTFTPLESNSWFSMKAWIPLSNPNLQKISSQSSMFSIVESTEKENTKKPKKLLKRTPKKDKVTPNANRRVRLRPTPEVANTLKKWIGTVRYTYNWVLSCYKKKPKEYKLDEYWLRKRFVNEVNIPKDRQWILDTPKHVRDGAIKDFVVGCKNNLEKRKEDPNFQFDMKFRSKKDKNQSIVIPYDAIKAWKMDPENSRGEFKMYPTYIKNSILFYTRKNTELPSTIKHECRLVMNKLGHFHLHISIFKERSSLARKNQTSNWASVDLGVRTLATIYSPTPGVCFKIADKDISRIQRMCQHLDKLISRTSKASSRAKKRRMQRAQERMRQRIHHLVDDVHWKSINFILERFDNIILPPFKVSNMVKKGKRVIGNKTVRQMLTWRFYDFRKRLITRAKSIGGIKVYENGEEYTSKTCTGCLKIKNNLGGAKIYQCHHCGLKVDRDIGGARNIFLKNASLR